MKTQPLKVGQQLIWKHLNSNIPLIVTGTLKTDKTTYILEHLEGDLGWSRDSTVPSDWKSVGTDHYWFLHWDEFANVELVGVSVKVAPTKPPKFALEYELDDENITEFFPAIAEAKAKIRVLAESSELNRDSIRIHTLAGTQKVELGTSITFKKA